MKKARDYQKEGFNTVLSELNQKNKKDQLLVLATGMGKTHVACMIKQEFPRTLWLTHKEELIDQSALSLVGTTLGFENHGKIDDMGGYLSFLENSKKGYYGGIGYGDVLQMKQEVGVVKGQRMDIGSRTIVASVQTMVNRLEYFKPTDFDLIIADEAHYAMAKSWVKILEYFKPELKLGLTATPYRLDGASLGTMFGSITYEKDIKYGIDNGWLVEINAVRVKTDLSLDSIGKSCGELKIGELERVINNPVRNNLIVEKYKQYSDGKQAIVFAVDVKHCMDLHKTFESQGVKSTFVVADQSLCPDRRERFAAFKGGDKQVLVNVDIATTGFDHDMVETLITARPTMSLALYLQMVGRGTRTQKGAIDGIDSVEGRIQAIRESDKKDLTILDITDNSQKHRLVNTWTLESDKDPEERVFITKEKREKLIAAREERKLKHKQAEDQRVDLLRLPKISVYKSGKNLEPATEKQVAILKKLGYDTDGAYYTKYDATLIISELPAFDWQIRKLKSMGYDTSKGVTAGQYSKVIQQIEAEKISKPVEHNFKTLNLPFIGLE